jgi:hypothetical protein
MREILAHDWTLVTRNSDDFRPRSGSAARSPCYVGVSLHAGLVCLNMPALSKKSVQLAYFRAALDHLAQNVDLTNEVLEVWPDEADPGAVFVQRYEFPAT